MRTAQPPRNAVAHGAAANPGQSIIVLARPTAVGRLIERIESLVEDRATRAGDVLTFGALTLDVEAGCLVFGQERIALGRIETRLLAFFIALPDKVVSRTQLLQRLWPANTRVAERTVDVYIGRLRVESIEADYLFLVGDIVDFWSLRRSFYWPEAHNEVLRTLLAMAREGTKIIYIPGNHDEDIREFCGSLFGNVSIRRKYVHSTVDGRELLVMHGDEFDSAVKCSRWLARFGATAYDVMMRINRGVNFCRRAIGLPHWSLASYLKLRLPNAVRYVEAFEHAAAQAALSRNLSGIVCGHIHRPGMREIDGVLYCNDGDWVESCSALVESMSGELSLWYPESSYRKLPREELVGVAA